MGAGSASKVNILRNLRLTKNSQFALLTIRWAIVALNEDVARSTGHQREAEMLLVGSPRLRTKFRHWQVELVTHALQHTAEDYRVDAHQGSHNVVYQTARSDLMALHALRLLAKAKQGNASVYFLPDDLHDRLTKLAK